MKTTTIPIRGMHCRSCEIMLEDELSKVQHVSSVSVSLKSKSARITSMKNIPAAALQAAVQNAGYTIGHDTLPWLSKRPSDYRDVGISILLVALIAFIVSQAGLTNISTSTIVTGGLLAALLIGITAGLSTCMALVGGLVLGLSAKHAERHPNATTLQKFRPHVFFNVSRVISFFLFGGLIGLIGSTFQLQGPTLGILTVTVGVVMLVLGLQLTKLFPRLSTGGITLPSSVARVLGIQKKQETEYSHRNAVVLGAASFFLPCGFTQAMQLYAMSTGSFTTGALVMGLFALGTVPGLLGIGGLTAAAEGSFAKRFFKFAGVAVIAMSLVNITNGYNLTGWPRPLASRAATTSETLTSTPLTGTFGDSQSVTGDGSRSTLKAKYTLATGLVPTDFTVKANQDYTLEVAALENGVGCMSTILIPGLDNTVQYLYRGHTNELSFNASRPGTYLITCAMGVPHGKITVV